MGDKRYIRKRGNPIAAEVNEHPDFYRGVEVTARFADDAVKAGRIAGFPLGRAHWTTPEDIRDWIDACSLTETQHAQAV